MMMTKPEVPPTFADCLLRWQADTEAALAHYLPESSASPTRLHEAMRYSVLGGGKRVRPALVYATAAALGLSQTSVTAAACAVEMIHVYSLIHDDLPAMDDDNLRRGRPTCHKAFDEATAILAGDALQVLAFELLATDQTLPADPAIRLQLVRILAQASGTAGMAGGQALDLAAEGQILDLAALTDIHARKTGALIRASVFLAAACQPGLNGDDLAALDRYAGCVGLAFQIQDDLLDIEGDPVLLGKSTGADLANQKYTYPAIVGIEAAHAKVAELHRDALATLAHFGPQARHLRDLTSWLVLRQH
ncbi:MAG: polyprenyl synthetase family protein [Steroidobacteraceae bacterium]